MPPSPDPPASRPGRTPPTAPSGPPSSETTDAAGSPRPASTPSRSGRPSTAPPPGPDAETIGRPQPAAYVGLLITNALLIAMIVHGFAGGGGGLVILGLILLALLGLALYTVVRARVDLDGSSLHVRWGTRWATAVDLDRLTSVDIDVETSGMPAPTFMKPRWLRLVDATGAAVSVNPGFTRTGRLKDEIASRIRAGTIGPEMNTRARRAILGRRA